MLKRTWTCVLSACLSWLSLTWPASAEVLLPGILDVTPVPGAHVVSDCGHIILPGDERATNISCVYFLDERGSERMGMNGPSAETLTAWLRRWKMLVGGLPISRSTSSISSAPEPALSALTSR